MSTEILEIQWKNSDMAGLIQKEILRDKVCEILRGWILTGKLKPGERIVESSLATEFQVSRAPIREALWLLAHQGLVRIQAHQGAFVTRLTVQDIREIFEIREALESLAARKIRATLTPERTQELKDALSQLERAARQKDLSVFSDADLRFHRLRVRPPLFDLLAKEPDLRFADALRAVLPARLLGLRGAFHFGGPEEVRREGPDLPVVERQELLDQLRRDPPRDGHALVVVPGM